MRRVLPALSVASSVAYLIAPKTAQNKAVVPPNQNIRAELDKFRHREAETRKKWIQDEEGFHKLPPRAWPPNQPTADKLQLLKQSMDGLDCPRDLSTPLNTKCAKAAFDLATCLTFTGQDAPAGLERYRSLAIQGMDDAMTAVGVVLLEGIGGVPSDEEEGVRWLRKASSLGNAQAFYELGVLEYMEGSSSLAFDYFSRAALSKHTSALYMVADCLFTGYGCEVDCGRAIPFLISAADQGHRLARAVLLELLDEDKDWEG